LADRSSTSPFECELYQPHGAVYASSPFVCLATAASRRRAARLFSGISFCNASWLVYPPDWLDTDTAAYMVSMSVDTFNRWVEAGTFPKPVVLGGKRLWHRGRLSESLDRLDPAYGSDDDPIMKALKAKTEERAIARLKKG
jgi:hypothetical protein